MLSRRLTVPTLNVLILQVVKERSTLFFGKRFVFVEEAQRQRMKQAIELAGELSHTTTNPIIFCFMITNIFRTEPRFFVPWHVPGTFKIVAVFEDNFRPSSTCT